MKAIELTGDIDNQHRLHAHVPEELPVGPVRVIVLLPDEDGLVGFGLTASLRSGQTSYATHGRTSIQLRTDSP